MTRLDETLAIPFDGLTMAITHQAPPLRCVPPAPLMTRITCAGVSDLDWRIERHQPDAWV